MVAAAENEKKTAGSGPKNQQGSKNKRGKQAGQRNKNGQQKKNPNGNSKNQNQKNNNSNGNQNNNNKKKNPQGDQDGNKPTATGGAHKPNNNNNKGPAKGKNRRRNPRKPAPKSDDSNTANTKGEASKQNQTSSSPSKRKGNRNRGGNQRNNNNGRGNFRNNKGRGKSHDNIIYPAYWTLEDCLTKYNAKDPNIIRGTIRVLPMKDAMAFCTCDRGSQPRDVMLEGPLERNRSLDGDTVFVELLPDDDEEDYDDYNEGEGMEDEEEREEVVGDVDDSDSDDGSDRDDDEEEEEAGDSPSEFSEGSEFMEEEEDAFWQDDAVQVDLWDPVVNIQRSRGIAQNSSSNHENQQQRGRVVYVVPPKAYASEINPSQETKASFRKIVGTFKRLQSGTTLLTCSNKCLPQFRLSNQDAKKFKEAPDNAIFQARYDYGAWQENHRWPPCSNVVQFGQSCNIEDETAALLIENQVDHGEHPPDVLEECQTVVASGEYSNGAESGWRPTPEMYKGRRDYRTQRIFTIDPTTAKDLDDALHITDLGNGQVELGVHIADVSYFVEQDSLLDVEAQRRCTTVYLVDRVIPMLPRPLCEIACSLNENVERLAFSCVWRMNKDGSVVKGHKVWYGRSVIKSCARLDYATAQNIIEEKVAHGENENENEIDEELWPKSRRPTGGHTIEEVAADVRLMNVIAQARRRMRFKNGALGLNSVKLTFQLDGDGETPLLCKPYEIRDSNRLVEEYMLLANYLVAQRLITHAGGRACLRNHETPLYDGLEKVAAVAHVAIGFKVDIDSSEGLQRSLSRLAAECQDELVLKCITEMLKLPMKPAEYIAAGNLSPHEWAHFALNIPYYTHFTSPIRRYADVIVHRLLQATLDKTVDEFEWTEKRIGNVCERCNAKKEGSRKAQERSDTVFLALYLKKHPLKGQLGVVLSVGQKTFTVFLPSLGISILLFLDEHKDWIEFKDFTFGKGGDHPDRRIKLTRIAKKHKGEQWNELEIKFFSRIRVTCVCSEKAPIAVKLHLEGPW
eukprot:CAMPEP_0113629878 /NCGR_PEP_ID=MMETSP0017_2-20120614/15516_1 /TAXON_ID=2856 /ORGANISM="Cylindrotheca closterium" /LENGTH=1018 /DNA_ID=CAMNT_0000540305 /DNA_START=64 /DNA_END=3117 /DNA_ORIENTATION=+ /assembly_acc=CAM_ASM_000147